MWIWGAGTGQGTPGQGTPGQGTGQGTPGQGRGHWDRGHRAGDTGTGQVPSPARCRLIPGGDGLFLTPEPRSGRGGGAGPGTSLGQRTVWDKQSGGRRGRAGPGEPGGRRDSPGLAITGQGEDTGPGFITGPGNIPDRPKNTPWGSRAWSHQPFPVCPHLAEVTHRHWVTFTPCIIYIFTRLYIHTFIYSHIHFQPLGAPS